MPKKPPTPTTPTTTPLITSLGMLAPVNAAPILPGGIQPITPMQSNALSIPGTRPMGTIAPPITVKPRLGKIKPTKKLSQSQIAGEKNAEKIKQRVNAGFSWDDVLPTLAKRGEIELKAMDEVTRNAIPGMATFFGGLAADIKGLTYNKLLKGEEYSPKTMLQLAEDVQWLGGAVYDASGDNPYRGWFALEREFYDAAATGKPLTPPALRFGGTVSMVGAPLAKVASMGARGAALAAEAGAAEAASAGLISDAARFSRPAGSVVSEGAMAAKPGLSRAAQGLATTSKGLSTVTRVGANTMMMPLKPYTYLAGGLGSLVRNGTYLGNGVLAWGKKAAMVYREQAKTLVDSGLDIRDPQVSDLIRKAERHERWSNGWRLRREAATYARQANDEAAKVSRAITDETTKPEFAEKFGELTPEENQAVISVIDGHTQLLDHLSRTYNIPLALLTVLGRYNAFPKYWLSPEATALAADFLNGGKNMTPEQYSRMSRVVESVVTALTTQEQMKLEGRGRLRPLAPHHLIPVPIVEYLVRALRAAGRDDLVKFMEDAQDIWELPVEHPDRMDLLRLIIENAPPEVALDSSIYPAPMRPIVEMYRRLRRNLERGAIEAGTGEFPTSPRSGEPGAAARFAEKAKDIANKARERMDKLSEEIARLEERRANSIDKLRRLDIIERYVKGETAEALAKEYGIDIKGMNRILANSGLVRAKREMVALYENYKQVLARAEQMGVADGVTMEQLQAEIDIIEQKAQKIKGDYDIEMKRLQDERQTLDDEVQIIDTEEDALTEEMFDAEDDYVANGGDIRELESPDTSLEDMGIAAGSNLDELNTKRESHLKRIEELNAEKNSLSTPSTAAAEPSGETITKEEYLSALRELVKTGAISSSKIKDIEKSFDTTYKPNTEKKRSTAADRIAFSWSKEFKGIIVSDVNGELFWTNGYIMGRVADSPLLSQFITEPGSYNAIATNFEDAKISGFKANGNPTPDLTKIIPDIKSAREVEIVAVNHNVSLAAGATGDIVVLRMEDGSLIGVDAKFFGALYRPGITILATEVNKPVVFLDGKKLVGVQMPIRDAGRLYTELETLKRVDEKFKTNIIKGEKTTAPKPVDNSARLKQIDKELKSENEQLLDAYAEIADAEKRLQQPAKPAKQQPSKKLAPAPAAQPAEITEPSALLRRLDEIVKSTPYVDELVAENAELNTREIEKGLGDIDRFIDEYVKLNTTEKTETFAKDNKNKKLQIGAAPGNQRAVVLRRAAEVGRAIYASTPFVGNIGENLISSLRSITPEWSSKDPNLPPSDELRNLQEELLETLEEYSKIRLEIRTARDIKGASGTSKKISSMKIEADKLRRKAVDLVRKVDSLSRREYYYRAILDHLDGKWEEVSARIKPEDMPAPETAPRLAAPEAATNPRIAELEAKAAEIQKAIDEQRDEDDYYSNEGWERHEYLGHELAVVKAEIETYSQPISESDIMKFRQEHGGIPGKGWKRGETEWYTRSEMIREGEGPGYYTPENVNKGDLEPSRLHDWEAADFVENNPSDGIFVHISKASKGDVNGASPDVYISVPPTWIEFKERIENSISSQSQASENTWVRHHYVGNTKEEGAVTPALKKLLAYVEKKIADGETTIYEPNAAAPAPTTAPRLAEPAKRQATWSEVLPNAVENAKKTAGKSITILKGNGDYEIISGTPSSQGMNPSRIEVSLNYGDLAFSNTEVFNQYMSDPVIRLRVLDLILEEMPKLAEQVFARTGNYETFNIELSDVLNPEDYSPEAADYVDKNSYPYATPVVAYVAVINTGGFKKTVSLPEFIDTIQSIRDEVARSIGGTEQTPSLRPPSAPQNVPSQQVSISAELNAKLAQAEDIYTKIESGLINERDARDALEAIDETLTDEERRQLQGPLQPIVANIAEKLSSEEIGKTIHVFADKYRFSVVSNANTDTARMGGHRGNEKSYATDGTYVVFYLWPHAGNLLPTYDINQRKIPFTTVDDAINAIDQIIEKLPELYAKAAKKSGTDSYTRFEIYPDSQFKTKYGTEVAGVTLLNQGAFKKTTSLDEMITALRRVQEELRNSKSQEIPGLRVPETRQIPARPEDIVPDMSIEDPRVRDYVYESDLLKSLFAEQEQAYREAQTAKEKMKALADLIDAMQKNKEAYQKFTELLNKHKQSRVNLLKIPEQIAKKQSQQQAQQERAEKYSAIAEGIMGSDQMRLLNEMPYNIPLEVAMDPNVVYPGSVERQFMVPDESGGRLVNPIGPSYVPSQRPSTSAGGLPSYEARSGLSGWSKDRSENRRYGDREHIFDLNIVANRLAETAGVMTENEAMRLIVAQHGVNVVDILTPEVVERLIDESTREAKNMPTEAQQSLISDIPDDFIPGIGAEAPGVRSPARNLEFAIRKILGAKIIDQMKLRGYTPIDPFGKLGKRFMDYEVTQDTNFVPQYVPSAIARVTSILNPRDMNIILRSASAINRAFKTSTLAFSLMWQIGDLTTAVILAKMTGVDVGTMIARMKQVYEAEYGSARSMFDPNATPTVNEYGRLALQSGVQDVSSSTAEWALRRGLPRAKERPRLSQRLRDRSRMLKPAAKFAQGVEFLADRQFKINETINRITRHAFFLENLDRILKEKGTDLDTVVADGSWKTDMEIRKAVQDAAISANKWLGDFTDLTIAERQYISLAFPFYAWIKHIHKVFWALGKEHPESLAWYMYMGTLGSDTENDPLDLRLGTIPIFGGAASVNFLNPLADVFEGPVGGLLQGNIRPLGRATGPVLRLLGAGLLGTDIASGRSLTSPAGTGMYTETGMPMQGLFSPLDTSTWDRGAGYALQQFPIATRLMSLLPTGEIPGTNIATGPVLRYSTGEARLKPGTNRPVQQYGGQLASLGRLFSIPFIPSRTDEQIADVYKSARIRLKSLEKLKAKAEAND